MAPLKLTRLDYVAALGMFTYASSVVITPIVLLRIAEDLVFGLAEGGGIEAVRAGFLLAILIASGFAAAHFGKTRSLAAGGMILAAGLFGYAVAPTYGVVLGSVVLVGLGGGILEALLNPLVQDEHPEDSGRYLNLVNAFFSVGVVTAVLIVGDLLTRGVSWRILVAGLGVVALTSGVLFVIFGHAPARSGAAAGPAEPNGASSGGVDIETADIPVWSHAREIVADRTFWFLAVAMFAGGGAEAAFTFWSASYVQLGFGVLARGGAFATASFAGGMVVGRLTSGHFVRQDQLHILIIGSALFGVVAGLAAWAVTGFVAFMVVVFAAGLSIACFWPSIQSYAAAEMPDVDSTMLFILLSVGGIPGFGFSSWIMGVIAESHGLRTSLLVIPALLILLAAMMVISRRSRV
ncbi:MAG: MFS transporter [Alkalispirochaeta sp.]